MVYRSWTPPAWAESSLGGSTATKRASRTGPLLVMKDGIVLVAPSSVASATWGLGIGSWGLVSPGLVPPTAGWAWHMAQLLPLNVGPRPEPASIVPETESTSLKRASDWLNKSCSLAFSDGKKLPAAAAPARGPGSFACACANGRVAGVDKQIATTRRRREWVRASPARGMGVRERSMAPPC